MEICQNLKFNLIIFTVIAANTTVVGIQFHAKPETVRQIRKIWEAVFTSIYFLEFLIRIIGLRKFYFKDYWNIFSLAILILDIIGEVIQQVLRTSANLLSFVYAFRILQIFDLLHLTKFFTDLRLLTYAIVGSFTSLLHLSVLMCLVIFIYSILGMWIFGHIKKHSVINNFVNFENLVNSAILLFRLSTAEDYDSIYKDLTLEYPFCDPKKIPKECGNKGIMRVKFGTVEDTEEFRKLREKMQQKYEKMFPELKGSRFVETTMNLKRMDRAARIIQNRLKEYKAVKQMYSNISNS
ncbi:unnamed protein product [Larinioides sclopetarius]|uniref:Ion transport domain-containing protein n=1 Tax=Larinioides sclopetarius TaxID=280406 RepID=A0AAV2AT22_9ARAC